MILDMYDTYTKYLDQANKVNKKCNKICICIYRLKQELSISNEKKEKIIAFLEQQTIKVKHYKRMINVLKNLVSIKPDTFLSSIEKSMD